MKKISIFIMILAALTLGCLFLFPMWKITLLAPQYPEGVSMLIWVNTITDLNPGDMANINIMNHYVGMDQIHPESFPELSYLQYIVMGMMALGVLIAITKNWKLYAAWVAILIVLGCVGLWDFYSWEQVYGSNLNPEAAIKIPGMVYDPPFLGRKVLLNFIAYSYPAFGGLSIGISIGLGAIAAFFQRK